MSISLTAIIRNAVIHNEERKHQLIEIKNVVGCSRSKAKELYFAFLYKAGDSYLEKLLEPK